jgi:hypothetical protein
MTVISRFYGIAIHLLTCREFGAQFHAIYGDSELVVNVWPLRIVAGNAPRRVRDLVLEWAAVHQMELLAVWQRCQQGLDPIPIRPLV